MQKLSFLFAILFVTVTSYSQDYTSGADSDPVAKAILESMKNKYESFKTLEADFVLSIEIPEEPVHENKGKLIQEGDKYYLSLKDHTVVSDGKSVWLYIESLKEVQINDVDENAEEGTIASPKDLLRAYKWDDYVYILSNEFSEDGRVVQQIEFKPVKRGSEYSKIRLTLDKKTLDVIRIKSFGKDGSRYTVTVNQLKPNVTVPTTTFTFSKKDCPDCYFEDLRLN